METAEEKNPLVQNPRKWVRNGFAIAIVALLAAFGARRGVEQFLALPEGATVEEAGPSGRARPDRRASRSSAPSVASKRSYASPILRRNIFDSSAVGESLEEEVEEGVEGRRTDLDVTLLATVVAEPEEFSSALIESGERGDDGALGYGVGDELLGEATIISILQKKVIIRRDDGTVEYISMGQEEEPARTARGSTDDDGDEEGISKEGENHWVVDSSVVDEALSNIDKLASRLRAIPHRGSDGEIDGFRLSAIRRGSLLHKLGIKNGDVIHSVNGQPLTSASGAMSAYQSLQNETDFEFDITRRNNKQTFEYDIR